MNSSWKREGMRTKNEDGSVANANIKIKTDDVLMDINLPKQLMNWKEYNNSIINMIKSYTIAG